MAIVLNPYLNFRDKTREAMEFYHDVFGGELQIQTFGELNPQSEAGDADKVMHAQLEAPNGLVLMAADTPGYMEYAPGTNNFSVSLSGDDEQGLRSYFEKLSDGANIGQPLETAPWGDTFGMLVDKFGISWVMNISGGGH
jgi:PhnB protein